MILKITCQILFFNLLLFFISSCHLLASGINPSIELGAYIDTYYATDNDHRPDSLSNVRQFSYANPKKDQFSLNTAQITARVKYENNIRSILTFHLGDLHKTAWANAGESMPMIQQANVGFRIIDNFWIDGGYFLTHIGGESLLPKDNWLSSHSLVTYYEPFYQAGIKISYETDAITAQLHILNGNGIIDDNNFNKTFGWFIYYSPGSLFSISDAGVLGNEEPGSPANAKTHLLNCLVGQINPVENLSMKFQFDYGMDDVHNPVNTSEEIEGKFTGTSISTHYVFVKPFSATFRFAYVDNSDGVYSPIIKGMDLSLGAEYKPSDNSYIRIEGRSLQMDDKFKVFNNGSAATNSRMELILNMGVWVN